MINTQQLFDLNIIKKSNATPAKKGKFNLKFNKKIFKYHSEGRKIKYWIGKDDSKPFLFKMLDAEGCVAEVVASELAKALNLNSVETYIATVDEGYFEMLGILMPNFKDEKAEATKKHVYFNLMELQKYFGDDKYNSVTLQSTIHLLSGLKNFGIEEQGISNDFELDCSIIDNLFKLAIFDFVTLQIDRYACNIGFVYKKEKDKNKLEMSCIFDNEHAFDLYGKIMDNEKFEKNCNIAKQISCTNTFMKMKYDKQNALTTSNQFEQIETSINNITSMITMRPELRKMWDNVRKIDIEKIIRVCEETNNYKINRALKTKITEVFNYRRQLLENSFIKKETNSTRISDDQVLTLF